MFSHYWPGDGIAGGAPPATDYAHYSQWAATVSFLGLGFWPTRSFRKSVLRVRHNLWKLFPRRFQTWILATRLIFSNDYTHARVAVEWCAQAGHLVKRTEHWNAEMWRRIQDDPNVHENVSRFLAAADRMPKMDRNRRDTLIHLAWLGRKSV